MNLQDRASETVERWCLRAGELYGGRFEVDEIRFDIRRSAMMAGEYRHQFDRHIIRLNMRYLIAETEAFLGRTPPHEVAHMVNNILSERVPGHVEDRHGPNWRNIMLDFGLEPTRCHGYDTSHARPHLYGCGCPERVHRVTAAVHRKTQLGLRRCQICEGSLTYLGKFMKESRW